MTSPIATDSNAPVDETVAVLGEADVQSRDLSTPERRRLVAFRCWYSLRRQGVSRQEAEKLTFCKWLYDTRLQPERAAAIAS